MCFIRSSDKHVYILSGKNLLKTIANNYTILTEYESVIVLDRISGKLNLAIREEYWANYYKTGGHVVKRTKTAFKPLAKVTPIADMGWGVKIANRRHYGVIVAILKLRSDAEKFYEQNYRNLKELVILDNDLTNDYINKHKEEYIKLGIKV